jgi:hypothetical protein
MKSRRLAGLLEPQLQKNKSYFTDYIYITTCSQLFRAFVTSCEFTPTFETHILVSGRAGRGIFVWVYYCKGRACGERDTFHPRNPAGTNHPSSISGYIKKAFLLEPLSSIPPRPLYDLVRKLWAVQSITQKWCALGTWNNQLILGCLCPCRPSDLCQIDVIYASRFSIFVGNAKKFHSTCGQS